MRVLSVQEFKGLLGHVIKEREEIIVTVRGKPVGIFRPLTEEELAEERIRIGMGLVGLGKGTGGRPSEDHDEDLYE